MSTIDELLDELQNECVLFGRQTRECTLYFLEVDQSRQAVDAEIKRMQDRIAELEAAIDSSEIENGLTSNGNLWRFWNQKALELIKSKGR